MYANGKFRVTRSTTLVEAKAAIAQGTITAGKLLSELKLRQKRLDAERTLINKQCD